MDNIPDYDKLFTVSSVYLNVQMAQLDLVEISEYLIIFEKYK